jgi:hypothetical protein
MTSFVKSIPIFDRKRKAKFTFGFTDQSRESGIDALRTLLNDIVDFEYRSGGEAKSYEVADFTNNHENIKEIFGCKPNDGVKLDRLFRKHIRVNFELECACCDQNVRGRISWAKYRKLVLLSKMQKTVNTREFMSILFVKSYGLINKFESISHVKRHLDDVFTGYLRPHVKESLPANYFGLCPECQSALYYESVGISETSSLSNSSDDNAPDTDETDEEYCYQLVSAPIEPTDNEASISQVVSQLISQGFTVHGSPVFKGEHVFQCLIKVESL